MLERLIAMCLAVSCSGCLTYAYLPEDGQISGALPPPSTELKSAAASVSISFPYQEPVDFYDPMGNGRVAADVQRWFGGRSDDLYVRISNQKIGKERGLWTLIPYVLTLTVIPAVAHQEFESTMVVLEPDGSELLKNSHRYRMRMAMSLTPTAMFFGRPGKAVGQKTGSDHVRRHRIAFDHYISTIAKADYEEAVAGGSVDTLRSYIKQHPNSFFRHVTLRRLAMQEPSRNQLKFHLENVALSEDYLTYVPKGQAIWFVGPEGMRVHDVLAQSKVESEAVLAARIRAAETPYRLFGPEEVMYLQQEGLKPDLIAAMIDVSHKTPSVAQSVSGAMPSGADDMALGHGSSEEAGPGAGSIAADCAKRLMAMKGCEQIPSLGANICKAGVRKKYSHLACEIIQ